MGSQGPRSDIRVLAEIHNKRIPPLLLPGATQPPVPPSHVRPPRPRLHLHPQDITIEMCRLEAVAHFEYEVQSSASRHDHRQHTPVTRIAPHRPQMTHRGWCRHWLPRARSRDATRARGKMAALVKAMGWTSRPLLPVVQTWDLDARRWVRALRRSPVKVLFPSGQRVERKPDAGKQPRKAAAEASPHVQRLKQPIRVPPSQTLSTWEESGLRYDKALPGDKRLR